MKWNDLWIEKVAHFLEESSFETKLPNIHPGLQESGKDFREMSLSDLLSVYIEANKKAEEEESFMQGRGEQSSRSKNRHFEDKMTEQLRNLTI